MLMILRTKTKDDVLDMNQILVGDLAIAHEEVIESHENPIQVGAGAAILLAMFCALRAIELAASYGYKLRFASGRGAALDLRPTLAVYAILAIFLLVTAPRFTNWFAPGKEWRLGKIIAASFGFLLIMLSIQPLTMLASGLTPTGKMGNLLSVATDYEVAAYGPLFLGLLLLMITALPSRINHEIGQHSE